MKILPVIDLLHGRVVRGIAGRRDEYRPIMSQLCIDAEPATVARAFLEKLNLTETYVADLDAIAGAEPAWQIYDELTACGLHLWIDCGIRDAQSTHHAPRDTARRSQSLTVAGLETLASPETLTELLNTIGPERLVFSLDLKAGQPLTGAPAWANLDAEQIAAIAIQAGVRRLIVLDLANVGVSAGIGTESLCRKLHTQYPDVELTSGGGVRHVDDLRALESAGCSYALVASALHDGRITAADLATRRAL